MYDYLKPTINYLNQELINEQKIKKEAKNNLKEDLLQLDLLKFYNPIDILLFIINSKETWDISHHIIVKLIDYPKLIDDLFNILLEREEGYGFLLKDPKINNFYTVLIIYYFNYLEIEEEIKKRCLTSKELAIIFSYLRFKDIHGYKNSLVEIYIKDHEEFFWKIFNKEKSVNYSQLQYVTTKLLKYHQYEKVIKLYNSYLQANDYISVDLIVEYIKTVGIIAKQKDINIEEYYKPIQYSKWFFSEINLDISEFARFEKYIFEAIPEYVDYFDFEYLLKYYISDYNNLKTFIINTLDKDDNKLFEFLTSGVFNFDDINVDNYADKLELILNDKTFNSNLNEVKVLLGHFFYLILQKDLSGNEKYFKLINNDKHLLQGYVSCLYNSQSYQIKQYHIRYDVVFIENFKVIDKELQTLLTMLNLAGLYNIEDEVKENYPILDKEKKLYFKLYEKWEHELNADYNEDEVDNEFNSYFYQ